MIVTCERCETEFQLDDARVPTSGTRVRCSRCKHAFFVMPRVGTSEEAVDQLVGVALADDPTPDVTEDLPEATPISEWLPDVPDDAPERSVAARVDDESDWEFNARLPDPAAGEEGESLALASGPETERTAVQTRLVAAPETARTAGPVRGAAAPETDDLGSPVDWDFFDRPGERAAPVAPALPLRRIEVAREIATDATRESDLPRQLPLALRRVIAGAGWFATASLCAIALLRGLAPAAAATTAWPSPAPGVRLEQVSGRWFDNVSLGRLYVVSGRLHNVAETPTSLPPLVLDLRDPSGRTVGDPIPLRGASAPERLREVDAASLATVGGDFPGGLAAGVTWDFEAVAWPLPAQAVRFAIRPAP